MSRRATSFLSWCVLLALVLGTAPVLAQEYRGRVQGTATDASQAVVVGATVTLLNVNTGISATRQTSADGHYLFDLVEPGTYSVTVELVGFAKFVQENVVVASRGDVTVNATLRPGTVQETVTVTDTPVAVQFNTSKVELSVPQQLANSLPQMNRNPFLLAQLDPAVEKNDYNTEYAPYHTWGANQQRVGGGDYYTNDLQVDGSPVTIGVKTGYAPSPDSVQEVIVQQNAVDAEYGYSSGSAISLVLKAGTNELHGTAFYQGQYPWANALENRDWRTINKSRKNMFGATVGHPIMKNRLFNFFAWEQWKYTEPSDLVNTLPTDLERQGDFSQSLNGYGSLRTIYDPWTTQTAPDGTVTRTPFAENKIPPSMQDPVARDFLSKLWTANRPGTGPYHDYNYYVPLPINYGYKNFSDRVDFYATDKLRMFARLNFLRTPVTTSNPTGSEYFVSDRESQRDATLYSGDIVYTLSANTVLNLHGDWHNFVDDAKATGLEDRNGWSKWWPNSDWYKPLFAEESLPVFLPRLLVMRDPGFMYANLGMGAGFWYQHPDGDSANVKVAHQRGPHYLKFGFETRANRAMSYVAESAGFGFFHNTTNKTYINPDLLESGDGYATFLLGAIEANPSAWGWGGGQTVLPIVAMRKPETRAFAGYVGDDWKVSRKLTLNLGLRYEYEQPFRDPEDRLPRPFDLNNPIPEMQANPPQMPDLVSQYYSGPWNFTGAFQFVDSNNRSEWNGRKGFISPRIGAAFRLNDRTAIRAAWARYFVPWVKLVSGHNYLDINYPGFDVYNYARAALEGVPQQRLADPFPASAPLIAPVGKSLGRYTNLGDSLSWVYADRPKYSSDRINLSIQRQLPNQMVLDVTYFLNWTHGLWNTRNLNMVDPQLWYTHKGALNQTVPNPFYNYLTPDKFPGSLRYEPEVSIASLMKPYPQYRDLVIDQHAGGEARYHSLQMKLQKAFSQGYTLLVAYNYHFESLTVFYDDIATYNRNWTFQDSDAARHRLSGAGVWEVPVGKNRKLATDAPRALDALIGGWNLNGILSWRSGRFLRFGGYVVNGDPIVGSPSRGNWFNTSVFSRLPAYTPRTNPWQYPGLTGPGMLNVDASLVKSFTITEWLKAELQMQAFNALNNFTPNDVVTSIDSPEFGKAIHQLANTYGRRVQLGMKLVW